MIEKDVLCQQGKRKMGYYYYLIIIHDNDVFLFHFDEVEVHINILSGN